MRDKIGLPMTPFAANRRCVLKGALATGVAGMAGVVPGPFSFAVAADNDKILEIRLAADIQNLDPAFEPQDYDLQVIFNIYENLVGFRPGTFELINTLAESWTPSADGTRFEFKLKEGMRFHRGYGDVTAEDVKFSFERIAGLTQPPVDSPYKKLWAALQEVQVTGPYSGVIVLKHATAPLMNLTVPNNVGQIVSKKAVEELGDKFATNPVGTGTYEFVEWRPRERIVLRKFKEYSGANSAYAKPVEWEEIHFLPIPEDSSAEISLESGDLDFGAVPLSAVSRFEGDDNFTVHERTGFGYKFIGMNIEDPALSNIDVRKAIRFAIDVPAILAAGFEGRWQRATAVLPPSMPFGHWENAPVVDRDLDKAREHMKKAGVSELTLNFTYNNSEPGGATVAEIAQANLKEIGITLNVTGQENAIAMQTGEEAQKGRQIFYVGFGSQGDPAQSMSWFTCEQINKWNLMGWCDDAFTKLAAAGIAEMDQAKRKDIYFEMQRMWDEAANAVWIAWPTTFFAARKGLDPSLRPDGRMLAWNFRTAAG